MKTLEELRQFYDTTLINELIVLEAQRKAVVKKVGIAAAGILAVIAVVLIVMRGAMAQSAMFALFPVVFGLVVLGVITHLMARGYVGQFKDVVIYGIVKFIDETLSYSKHGYIGESVFRACEIFKRQPDRYKGDDLVAGKLGATEIEFSEIHAEYKTTTTDSKGRRKTHWHTIFKGLFFIGDFNKDFACEVVVLPDTAERFLGRLGQMFQSWNIGRGELIKLEDPEFEKLFAVYGDDQIQARYILSTSLMKRIVDFKKKTGRQIFLSFIRSRIYVAVSYNKSLFEPRLLRTLIDFAPIQEYFEDLQVAIGIVDDLNLNTRIWSKQ